MPNATFTQLETSLAELEAEVRAIDATTPVSTALDAVLATFAQPELSSPIHTGQEPRRA